GGPGASAEKEPDLQEFNGPSNVVLAKVEALKKKGMVSNLRRVYLTALEHQPVSLMDGASKPFVTGLTGALPGGPGGFGGGVGGKGARGARGVTDRQDGPAGKLEVRLTAPNI